MSWPTITVDELESTISKMLDEYGDEVTNDLNDAVKETAREATKVIREAAPVDQRNVARRGTYKRAITAKQTGKSRDEPEYKIWASKEYRLAHLLEYGHQTAKGRTKAQPHFAKGEEYVKKTFEKKVRDKIEK